MKFKKICIFAVAILLASIFLRVSIFACTIFTGYDDNTVLVGNNEDWQYSYDSMYWIVKGENDEYSRVCFGNSTYTQGGMNEKGLFYDGAYCPETQVPNDVGKETLGMNAGDVVLSQCATVKEVVEFFGNYNISASFGDHLMFADSSGDAAVIVWVNNEMRVIPAENNRLVAENFFLTEPELGGYPSDRYDMAEELLSRPQSLSILEFSSICRSTSQDWGDGGTKYSNVYDLKALKVYVYEKADFSQVAVIGLQDELDKLTPGEKSTDNINTLVYSETSSLLGGEVIDYRNTTDNTTNNNTDANNDEKTESAATISPDQSKNKEENNTIAQPTNKPAATTGRENYPIIFIPIIIAAIAIIVLVIRRILLKKAN